MFILCNVGTAEGQTRESVNRRNKPIKSHWFGPINSGSLRVNFNHHTLQIAINIDVRFYSNINFGAAIISK